MRMRMHTTSSHHAAITNWNLKIGLNIVSACSADLHHLPHTRKTELAILLCFYRNSKHKFNEPSKTKISKIQLIKLSDPLGFDASSRTNITPC
jgi:hypothetical protein